MAVPKKRTSRTKTKQRKAVWLRKADLMSKKAWSLGCSIAKGSSNSFVLDTPNKSD
uniref:Large ribosomal subunit protein bL32c n=1 Tax=Nannochloropsis oceanica TaxID=145522 RepID=T1RJW3_9STRA|nr:ribosomal protein L32 [Nannochloropsis oceanica]AGI99404.1 ribosomal protein L32 [Nannochloropsis oceanica]AHX25316.1 50S ribosomal protein L32 [Nannochloropsis oceanica]